MAVDVLGYSQKHFVALRQASFQLRLLVGRLVIVMTLNVSGGQLIFEDFLRQRSNITSRFGESAICDSQH